MKSKLSVALCALSILACNLNQRSIYNETEVNHLINNAPATMNSNLAAASNAFGFDLFQQLWREGAAKNVFFSPFSVTTALAMTYNGAAGETKSAMARALRIEGMSDADLNSAAAESLKALKNSDPKIELEIANSLWARGGARFNDDFLARNRKFYNAEISALNFSDPQSVTTINRWVSDHTKGKISQIIDKIDPQKIMFLINAVYFKGQWKTKFKKELTKEEPFHLSGGRQKPAQMMAQSGDFPYYRGDKFQAISLPYGNGGVSLYIFLPDQESSLDEFLKGFSCQKWDESIKNFEGAQGDIKLPRFKFEYEKTLNEALKGLGMGVAFSERADFREIRPERDLYISEVIHKAFVEVNEEGTEAAAATSVGIRTTAIPRPRKRFTFIADRPFLMAIRDSQSGAILFMGAVMEP